MDIYIVYSESVFYDLAGEKETKINMIEAFQNYENAVKTLVENYKLSEKEIGAMKDLDYSIFKIHKDNNRTEFVSIKKIELR